MKFLRLAALACTVAVGGVATAQAADHAQAKDTLVGAWHLVSIAQPGADGRLQQVTDLVGSLVYTRDGHMSVQLMYPAAQSSVSNDYVQNGYEASFGRYDVNETVRTVTHHVEGANVRSLVGKDLPRSYRFLNGQLIIEPTRADEHWSVTWAHD